ncbi:hypothetical protein POL68_21865 [Stigmatella sp. ncwal1]|uniref:Uncharacterized protein n=1 Tax=Stigmatella ashevillensis TaxID=2995309 RepID=A0ABT5DBW7_9BACT|nr:hypothetical protein [Stigmatella ashevillena]MDC0711131.1 hypothetical protein [Stigmatella ashevillena]
MQLESLRLSTLLMVTQFELLRAREALDGSQEAWQRLQAVSARATAVEQIAEELLSQGGTPASRV